MKRFESGDHIVQRTNVSDSVHSLSPAPALALTSVVSKALLFTLTIAILKPKIQVPR